MERGRRVAVFFSVLFFLASLLFLFFCFGRNRDRNPVLGWDGGEEVYCCRLEFGKERGSKKRGMSHFFYSVLFSFLFLSFFFLFCFCFGFVTEKGEEGDSSNG